MGAWGRVLEAVHDDLRYYPWQPWGQLQLPAIWNWLLPSTWEVMDTARGRDSIVLITRVGVRHTTSTDEMDKLTTYADAFRDKVDPLLWAARRQPLEGTVFKAKRNTMQMESLEIGGLQVLVVSFNMQFDVDRRIA